MRILFTYTPTPWGQLASITIKIRHRSNYRVSTQLNLTFPSHHSLRHTMINRISPAIVFRLGSHIKPPVNLREDNESIGFQALSPTDLVRIHLRYVNACNWLMESFGGAFVEEREQEERRQKKDCSLSVLVPYLIATCTIGQELIVRV